MGLEPEQDEGGGHVGSGLRHWGWDSDQISKYIKCNGSSQASLYQQGTSDMEKEMTRMNLGMVG